MTEWLLCAALLLSLIDRLSHPMLNGLPVANAPAPGKRPLSAMSPTIVFDEAGDPFMITGSPGGNSIVGYVSKTLVAVLDWGATAQQASAAIAAAITLRSNSATRSASRGAVPPSPSSQSETAASAAF